MPKTKILIVEDDDIVARVIAWRLNNIGYEVCGRATSSTETMEILVKEYPDVVLMDINIKGETDGIETANMIKTRVKIPVIFLTSHSDGSTLQRAKETQTGWFCSKTV